MAEQVEVVIKIPVETYEYWKNHSHEYVLAEAIKNGTPLPKGHGRLIDADRLKEEMEKDVRRSMSLVDLTDFAWLAPTIIEADKAETGNT